MHKRNMRRIVAVILMMALTLPVGVCAAEPAQPWASDNLFSYNGYVYPAGDGELQVWFTVDCFYDMDDIGALRIVLYESTDNTNWTSVKTYTSAKYPSMMGHDDSFHSGHVDYQGIVGRYYRAYIGIWAGLNGTGDSRYFYTSSKRAI